MDREKLYKELDIEGPEDMEYFEQFAFLVESSEIIEYDDFYHVLSVIEADDLSEITENFFSEIEKFIPNESDEIYSIVDTVSADLKRLSVSVDDSTESRKEYIQKLYTFHEWYTKEEGASVDGNPCCVCEAIFEYRAQKLDNTQHRYSFENSMDYDFDYLSMPIGGIYDNENESYTAIEDN